MTPFIPALLKKKQAQKGQFAQSRTAVPSQAKVCLTPKSTFLPRLPHPAPLPSPRRQARLCISYLWHQCLDSLPDKAGQSTGIVPLKQ